MPIKSSYCSEAVSAPNQVKCSPSESEKKKGLALQIKHIFNITNFKKAIANFFYPSPKHQEIINPTKTEQLSLDTINSCQELNKKEKIEYEKLIFLSNAIKKHAKYGTESGIFRIPGNKKHTDLVLKYLKNNKPITSLFIVHNHISISDLASAYKQHLAALFEKNHKTIEKVPQNLPKKLDTTSFPDTFLTLDKTPLSLQLAVLFLAEIAENEKTTLMNAKNLAICIAPNFTLPNSQVSQSNSKKMSDSSASQLEKLTVLIPYVETLIKNEMIQKSLI
ncbi:Rho GTPase-activating protein [Providencia rettgeri]|nr:hypothetical protein [Providencia rettgeri]